MKRAWRAGVVLALACFAASAISLAASIPDLARRAWPCVDLMATGAPAPQQLRDLLAPTQRPQIENNYWTLDGGDFEAVISTRDVSGEARASELVIYPQANSQLRWRHVKTWSPRWRTIATGERTIVVAEMDAAASGGRAYLSVHLLASPAMLNGRVLAIKIRPPDGY